MEQSVLLIMASNTCRYAVFRATNLISFLPYLRLNLLVLPIIGFCSPWPPPTYKSMYIVAVIGQYEDIFLQSPFLYRVFENWLYLNCTHGCIFCLTRADTKIAQK